MADFKPDVLRQLLACERRPPGRVQCPRLLLSRRMRLDNTTLDIWQEDQVVGGSKSIPERVHAGHLITSIPLLFRSKSGEYPFDGLSLCKSESYHAHDRSKSCFHALRTTEIHSDMLYFEGKKLAIRKQMSVDLGGHMINSAESSVSRVACTKDIRGSETRHDISLHFISYE